MAIIYIFIFSIKDIYDLLLSKRQIRRVYIIKDHSNSTLIIKEKDNNPRLIYREKIEFIKFKIIGSLVNIQKTSLIEEEIARLVDKLDKLNFNNNYNPINIKKVSSQ